MRTLSWWVSVVWVLAFIVLVLNAIVALYNVNALRRTDARVTRAEDTRATLGRLTADVADAESATRGFVVSGRTDILEPYHAAERAIDGRLARLRDLVAGDPELEAAFARVVPQVRDKFADMRDMIEVRRGPDGEARARDMVNRGVGKETMDRLRAGIEEVDQL
ncbi:MAG TPA: CHASE3 domain-containing protein, partial [Gemmataceae bacterium]|nr:CHASE3 domain-containing protein [Gemmataceae bacterium]